LKQTQQGDVYRLPLEIGITGEADAAPARTAAPPVTDRGAAEADRPGQAPLRPGPQTRIERLELDARQKTFTIASDKAPLGVQLDPNTSTLMEMEFSGPRP
jgi:hypothetical protein